MYLVDNFALFSLIVSLGIFVQSATGFAAGLIIIPLMGYAGYGVPEGQAVLLAATIPQNFLGVWQFRDSIEFQELKLPAMLRFAAFPVGFAALCFLDTLPLQQIRQVLGAIILLCVGLLCAIRPASDAKLSIGWTLLAFLSSGFFAGLTGTGGPMMVLWVQAHHWSTEKNRAFLFCMYLIYTGPALLLLWWRFEARIVSAAVSVVVLMPLLLLVSTVGLRFGSWLGRRRLRLTTMLLLVVIACLGIFST